MKRLLVSALAMVAYIGVSQAQTEQGNWLVGGNLELNTAKKNTVIALNPSAGYFFLKNLAAGVGLNLNYTGSNGNKATTFGVGPFARYYFGTLNVRPFLDGELRFQSNKYKVSGISSTDNNSQYFLGGGLAAFINRNVAIEGLVGYRHTSDGSGGLNIRAGFQVYISSGEVQSMTK